MFIQQRKKRFDEEGTEDIPPKNRPFKLKTARPEPQPQKSDPLGTKTENILTGKGITDDEGLDRAYSQGDAYAYGNTLYIAGSHTARDWYDDVTKVPFYGDLRNAERYKQAEKALKANPNITKVVGHSLGGSVALELQKNYPNLESRTYGAPVWDPFGYDKNFGKVERYRNLSDPVSFFDGSANNNVKWNPFDSGSLTHDYHNIGSKLSTEPQANAYGWTNPDKSISITQ